MPQENLFHLPLSSAMKSIVLVSTTVEKKEDAERLAAMLLDHKLIACAQISAPITSLYRWKGVTTSATEYTLSLKTSATCLEPVQKMLREHHPYELPEIIIQEIDKGSQEYFQWVLEEVQK